MIPAFKLLGFNAAYVRRGGVYMYAHFQIGGYRYVAAYCLN